jgi:hypothetical protein
MRVRPPKTDGAESKNEIMFGAAKTIPTENPP